MPENIAIGAPGFENVNPIELALKLQVRADQRKREELQRQKEQQAQLGAMQKYLNNMFSADQYHTGMDIDKLINDRAGEALTELKKMLLSNKDIDPNTLDLVATQKRDEIFKLKTIGDGIKNYVNQTTDPYKDDKGINNGYLKIYARNNAMYKKDANGNWILKHPDEMNLDTNYVTDVLKKNPKAVLNGDGGFSDHLKSLPVFDAGDINQTDRGGVKKKTKWTAQFYPSFQELVKDKSGNVTGVRIMKTVAEDEKGDPVLVNGKPLEVVPDNTFKTITATPGTLAYVSSLVQDYAEKNKVDIPPDSREWEMMAKHLLVKELESKSPKKFVTEDIVDQDAWKGKQDAGITVNVNGTGSSKGTSKDSEIRNIYAEVDALSSSTKKGMGAPLNKLSATAQKILLTYVNQIAGKVKDDGILGTERAYTNSDIYIKKEPNGVISIVRAADNKVIAPIDFSDVNIPAQVNAKDKRSVIQKAKDFITGKPTQSKNNNPLPKGKIR